MQLKPKKQQQWKTKQDRNQKNTNQAINYKNLKNITATREQPANPRLPLSKKKSVEWI